MDKQKASLQVGGEQKRGRRESKLKEKNIISKSLLLSLSSPPSSLLFTASSLFFPPLLFFFTAGRAGQCIVSIAWLCGFYRIIPVSWLFFFSFPPFLFSSLFFFSPPPFFSPPLLLLLLFGSLLLLCSLFLLLLLLLRLFPSYCSILFVFSLLQLTPFFYQPSPTTEEQMICEKCWVARDTVGTA